jgi:hypothetical protein
MGCSLALAAPNLPPQKLGSWESSTTSSQHPGTPMRSRMCFGPTTDSELKAKGEQYHCTNTDVLRQGDTYSYESTCQIGQHPMKTSTVVTYHGEGSFHSVSTSDLGAGKAASVMTTDSHWVGPCAAGQVPGEGELIK